MPRFLRSIQEKLEAFWRRVCKGSVLDVSILVCACLLAVVLIAILIFSLVGCMSGRPQGGMDIIDQAPSASVAVESDYDQNAASINKEEFDGTLLIESEDAGQEYVDETLFIGDSNTVRMVKLGAASLDNTLAAVSMGIQHVTSSDCMRFSGYGYITVPEAVELMQPQRILITYGTNNAYSDADTFIDWYSSALDAIQEAWPYADIIINAVPPVAKSRSYPGITMKAIDEFNLRLVQLAREKGCMFLDSSEALKGSDGYAQEGYMERDGIHLSQAGMDALMGYIRTHAYESEDRRPKPLKDVPEHYETPETFFNPPAPSSSQAPETTSTPAVTAPETCVHQWVEIGRITPTCQATGAVTYQCSLCGTQKSEVLPVTDHTWGPTDQATGIRVCTVCGASSQDPAWTAPPASSTPPVTPDPAPPASSTPPVTPDPVPPASSTPPVTPDPVPPASSTPPVTPDPAPPASSTPAPPAPPAASTPTPVPESTPAVTDPTVPAA